MAGGLGACYQPQYDWCQQLDEITCALQGGLFAGPGTLCGQVNTDELPCSCCDRINIQCITGLNVGQCRSLPNHVPRGPALCPPSIDCTPPEIEGACCYPDGRPCFKTTPEICEQQGGCYQGDGTLCQNVNCEQSLMSCCLEDGQGGYLCLSLQKDICLAAGGEPQCPDGCPVGDNCHDEPASFGACCLQSGACIMTAGEDACLANFGQYQGDGSVCTDPTIACGPGELKECREAEEPFYDPGDRIYSADLCALALLGFAVNPAHEGPGCNDLFMLCTQHETRSTDPPSTAIEQCRYHKAYIVIQPDGSPTLALCSDHDGRNVANLGGFAQQPGDVDDPNGILARGQFTGIVATENPRHGEVKLHSHIIHCGPEA